MKSYFNVLCISLKNEFKTPSNYIGNSCLFFVCLLIFSQFWRVVLGDTGNFLTNYPQFVWYIASNEWLVLSLPVLHLDVQNDLKMHFFDRRILLPVSYLGLKLSEGMGEMIVNQLFIGIIMLVSAFFLTNYFPFNSFSELGFFLMMSFFASLVLLVFHLILGFGSFWVDEIIPYYWVWEKLMFVLGGMLFPLAFYPNIARIISYSTPFAAALGMRSYLIFENSWIGFGIVSGVLSFWLILGLVFLKIIFKKSLNKFLIGEY